MNLEDLDPQECWQLLELFRWQGQPTCPYCQSKRASAYKNENRYHCHDCFTSYSVTVNTFLHRTRVDLAKWFYVIYLVHHVSPRPSIRQIAQEIGVSKNTVQLMLRRLEKLTQEDMRLMAEIINHTRSR